MSKYAVVIPSLANATTRPYLELCVKSLRESGFEGQIIVVTNGTKTPEPIPEIANMCTRLHTRDQGQCNAVNIGVQMVSPDTDYILISNDDMYYTPGWDKNLRFNYPAFSPNLVEPTDNNGSAAPFVKFAAGYTIEVFDKKHLDTFIKGAMKHFEIPRLTKVELGVEFSPEADMTTLFEDGVIDEPGLNFPLFIKKDFWQKLGGYDTAYDPFGSNSDTDLQTRINLAGVTPMRLRDVLVYHFSNKSGTFDGTHQDYYQNNLDYFFDKFGFSRDTVPGCDVWYNKNMLPEDESIIKQRRWQYV